MAARAGGIAIDWGALLVDAGGLATCAAVVARVLTSRVAVDVAGRAVVEAEVAALVGVGGT